MEVYSWENLIELNGDLIFSSKPCLITGCIWWWMEGANESLGAMVVSSFSPKKFGSQGTTIIGLQPHL
jgi:hypothetical protein